MNMIRAFSTVRLFLMSVVLCTAAVGLHAAPPGWRTNLTESLKNAEQAGQPALLYFTASWCGPCKLMARSTLTNTMVIQEIAALNPVVIDIDEQPDVAKDYNVSAVPTFQLVSSDGTPVARTTGYQTSDAFVEWMTNGVSRVRAVVTARKLFQDAMSETDRLLETGDDGTLKKIAAQLFDNVSVPDEIISAECLKRLETIAASKPAIVLEGMRHPRLATRIQISKLLQAKSGPEFDIDPWSSQIEREKAVDHWRTKLAH